MEAQLTAPALSTEPVIGAPSRPRAARAWKAGTCLLVVLVFVIAGVAFSWPVYRAFREVQIDSNEGWNAYFADAAMGRMPLYPAPDRLITNNYPPLSFYLVGGFGRLVGDSILAGRLLSLAAVLGIGVAVAMIVREMGGTALGASVAGAWFVATISRFSERYVGMNDPQLLAQVVMAFGFLWFVKAVRADRGWEGPILLMALAGFIKHNIIAMPFAAFAWLALHRPRVAVRCAVLAGVAVVFGFAACSAAYGSDFFFNMRASRQYSWTRSLSSIGNLRCMEIALFASLVVVWSGRRDPRVQLFALLTAAGLFAYFLQKTGEGVDENARFDLLIGASVGVGLALSFAAQAPRRRYFGPEVLASLLLLALCYRLVPSRHFGRLHTLRLLFDRSFPAEIAARERAMADDVEKVRAIQGDVITSNYVAFRAGKPFVVDTFNLQQRIAAGALTEQTVLTLLAAHHVTRVSPNPIYEWDAPLPASRPPLARPVR